MGFCFGEQCSNVIRNRSPVGDCLAMTAVCRSCCASILARVDSGVGPREIFHTEREMCVLRAIMDAATGRLPARFTETIS